MDVMEALLTRRSQRNYTRETVTDAELRRIVRAGMYAPSGHDRRPWLFLTVRDRAKMRQLMPLSPWWAMLETAQAIIVVCADTRLLNGIPVEFGIDSCCAASQNMLLAAHGLGLGGVWLGICEGHESYERFKAVLGIPDYARVVSMIAVGRPAETKEAEERMDCGKWFLETWGSPAPEG